MPTIRSPIRQARSCVAEPIGFCAPAATTKESSKRNSKFNRSSAKGPNLRAIRRSTLRSLNSRCSVSVSAGHKMKDNPRIAPREPINDGGNEARGQQGLASDPHFSGRRVGQKLNVLHALSQAHRTRPPTIEQRATVLGRLDALRWRSSRRTPSTCSRSSIDLEMTGLDMARCSAAFAMLRHCTTAIRMCRSRSLMRRPMRPTTAWRPHFGSRNDIIRSRMRNCQLPKIGARIRTALRTGIGSRLPGRGHHEFRAVAFCIWQRALPRCRRVADRAGAGLSVAAGAPHRRFPAGGPPTSSRA